jgi:hypothetical protein
LIRELKEENEKLKKQLAESGGGTVVTVEDEESKKQLELMKEQLEANQRQMEEMNKSWEDKLKEAKEAEDIEEKRLEEENQAKKDGKPHLLNLNEDPMLDRKVQYDIKPDEELYCGRRNKNSTHKLQLGGIGILPDHCKFKLGPK